MKLSNQTKGYGQGKYYALGNAKRAQKFILNT